MQRERNFYMFAKNQPKAKIETDCFRNCILLSWFLWYVAGTANKDNL